LRHFQKRKKNGGYSKPDGDLSSYIIKDFKSYGLSYQPVKYGNYSLEKGICKWIVIVHNNKYDFPWKDRKVEEKMTSLVSYGTESKNNMPYI